MMNGLRRTFWTSIHIKKDDNRVDYSPDRHKPTSRFGFFSNPSTPRSETRPDSVGSTPRLRCQSWTATGVATSSPSSLPASPKVQCRASGDVTPTATTPRRNRSPISLLSVSSSTPSSPKSPASYSLLKSRLCFTKSSSSRCGICLQSAKAGRGTAIFTAECSHTFHFPCVASRAGDRNLLADCPVCGASWRETSLLPLSLSSSLHELDTQKSPKSDSRIRESKNNKSLRVYNDDEPLISSPISPAGFNTILESDENDDEEEDNGGFKGFFVNMPSPLTPKKLLSDSVSGHVDVKLSSEAAIVAVGRGNETYSVVMKIKSPPLPTAHRSPVDLVTVLDVSGSNIGGKIEMVKRAMKLVISSLRETDRLSMVSFSSSSKRLSPLRRMTANGRRLARRIVDEISGDGDGMSVNDAVKKAAKVIDDRRQKNLFTTIFVLTDRNRNSAHQAQLTHSDFVSSTRFSHSGIPTHTIWFGACNHALPEVAFAKRVKSLLSVSVQDLTLKLGLVSGSAQGEITSVYSLSGRPVWLGSGLIRLGDMCSEEEREVLVELKSPASSSSSSRSHRIMTVRSRHVDATTQEIKNSEDRALLIPCPIAVRSPNTNIARLRNLHVNTRAVAESRRLIEANDYSGAERMLTSAQALLMQYGLSSDDACLRGLDAELADLNRLRDSHVTVKSQELVIPKTEPLTPTSAWRAAERLAKVAIMRKHMNRVSDLHGFENARF